MSFPDVTTPGIFPGLLSWLRTPAWRSAFNLETLKQGLMIPVESIRIKEWVDQHDDDSEEIGALVDARVTGSLTTPYRTKLYIRFDQISLNVHDTPHPEIGAACTCPVSYACKHAVAVFAKLAAIASTPPPLTTAAQKITESAKLAYLASELLPTLLEEGRRILLFSQFTSVLALIEEHLTSKNTSQPWLKPFFPMTPPNSKSIPQPSPICCHRSPEWFLLSIKMIFRMP